MLDPADLDRVQQAITQHSRTLREITDVLRWLTTNITTLRTQLSPSAQASASAPASLPDRDPYVPAPERYDGHLGQCHSFLLQCGLVFDQQPRTYPTDRARIAFVIGLLRGEALEWASAAWEKQSTPTANYDAFTAEIRKLFYRPVRGKDASKRLCSVVAEYAIEFRSCCREWLERGVFVGNFSERVE